MRIIGASEEDASAITAKLEALGWFDRGGHGAFCENGKSYWGYSMQDTKGFVACFDFTRHPNGRVTCNIAGLPDDWQ